MKVTVVIDNAVPPGMRSPFVAEHGLALLIESEGKRVLFDTGQTGAVVNNLSLLGVHPASLEAVVLSHGHYDHVGGLMRVLQHAAKPLPVYAHSDIFQTHISTAGKRHFIGIPFTEPQLSSLGAQWVLSKEPVEIIPGLWFSGEIPRLTDFEKGDARLLTCQSDGHCVEDLIADDVSLFHGSAQGLRVIGGCAHAGMINTIRHGLALTGQTKMHTWIGGTHLAPVSAEQQHATLDALQDYAPELIAANHCTGFAMMATLSQRFGVHFVPAFVGTVFEW
ncbi:MBL fold metallo-hydrolase [Rhodoferax antarcticus]|uniref:MBL fold metallo-hydrolase n=1 Tax=Rhodoferax antarcticus ANT.BR TaxID=1111071 RepID=A0A1Q8YJ27_9BURK|nr:MBL fold metallo-hydrolase [Rhodoferax antarcticus]APW48074.1 MBL fold metallo-hydrolase [Rhodoferax antarcticus]MCW2313433.1 7,8-dihydropterin-6-yl-methyl-4-(beta-D-ribofuranosyl)aminobenzene 5'-phosphate synthase [Rhodoferax antarcticus]OLP07929.1 MBL fold metallo-hydrolase [Rhodoferax antarcticus ANT.BR]